VREDDIPAKSERERQLWISHRDLAQLFRRSLETEVDFGIYFGISNNSKTYLDIGSAIEELGYQPQDDAYGKGVLPGEG
jgi:hypothetical protein